MKIGKWLVAEKLPDVPKRKTSVWEICNTTGSLLGSVKWFGRWRQYCFSPSVMTTFNAECLNDIARFLKETNDARRS